MPVIYRIFLMLLLGGGALACVAAGISQQHGVIMAGGLAALLCLAGLATPLPRGAAFRHPLAGFFRKPLPERLQAGKDKTSKVHEDCLRARPVIRL